MEKWEQALWSFLEAWQPREDVLAALATGSYVDGNNNESSDIDVHIVLGEEVDWRERGNRCVGGYLIEYFANPARQIYQYMDEDLENGRKIDANMFFRGRVLFDKTGIISEIKARAEKDLHKPAAPISSGELEMSKYGIWNKFDEMSVCYLSGSPYFIHQYCFLLALLLDVYSKILGVPPPPADKAYRFFKDDGYRSRYGLGDYPDGEFAQMYVGCVEAQGREEQIRSITQLKDYALGRMGGFEIDGWQYRSALQV